MIQEFSDYEAPPEAPHYQLVPAIESDQGKIILRPNKLGMGYKMTQDAEGFGAGNVENELTPRPGRRGAMLGVQRETESDMFIPIIIKTTSTGETRRLVSQLTKVLKLAEGPVRISLANPENEEVRYRDVVYREGLGTPEWSGPKIVKFSLTFDYMDPWAYSKDNGVLEIDVAPGATGGMCMDESEPISYTQDGGVTIKKVDGQEVSRNLLGDSARLETSSGWWEMSADLEFGGWGNGKGVKITESSDKPGRAGMALDISERTDEYLGVAVDAKAEYDSPRLRVMAYSSEESSVSRQTIDVTGDRERYILAVHITKGTWDRIYIDFLDVPANEVAGYVDRMHLAVGDTEESVTDRLETYFDASTPDVPPSVGLCAPLTAARTGGMRDRHATNEGEKPAPVTLQFNGPVTNPEVQIPGLWTFALDGTLQWDEYIVVDSKNRTISIYSTTSNATRTAYAWIRKGSRFSDLVIPPGRHPMTFRAVDDTYTASMSASWPHTYQAMY